MSTSTTRTLPELVLHICEEGQTRESLNYRGTNPPMHYYQALAPLSTEASPVWYSQDFNTTNVRIERADFSTWQQRLADAGLTPMPAWG